MIIIYKTQDKKNTIVCSNRVFKCIGRDMIYKQHKKEKDKKKSARKKKVVAIECR